MPEKESVYPGADDNASGTAGLMEIAQKLSYKRKVKEKHTLLDLMQKNGVCGIKIFYKTQLLILKV